MWKIRQRMERKWIGACICLVLGVVVFCSGYWLGKRSVQSEIIHDQTANGTSPLKNPNSGVAPPKPAITGASLPPNATPEMKEFMENRATLMQKMSALRQQSPGTNGAPDPKIFARFQQENAAMLQRQKELSQIISQQQARNPMPTPPPLQIPEGASSQLKTYLIARDALMRDQIAFMNQHRGDDPAVRQAAMQQWRQQNASRFQELQQEAQAMSQQNASAAPVKKTGI